MKFYEKRISNTKIINFILILLALCLWIILTSCITEPEINNVSGLWTGGNENHNIKMGLNFSGNAVHGYEASAEIILDEYIFNVDLDVKQSGSNIKLESVVSNFSWCYLVSIQFPAGFDDVQEMRGLIADYRNHIANNYQSISLQKIR